jgi:hypothetical protein
MATTPYESGMVAVQQAARISSCATRLPSIVNSFKGIKYNPRRDKSRGFAEWCSHVADALVLDPEISQVFETRCLPPDVPSLVGSLASGSFKMSIDAAVKLAEAAAEQYQQINKELFLILTQLIDLSGAYHEDDKMYIRSTFHRSSYRDGVGLLQWLETFADTTGHKAQAQLILTW